jgi:hypothetical protein
MSTKYSIEMVKLLITILAFSLMSCAGSRGQESLTAAPGAASEETTEAKILNSEFAQVIASNSGFAVPAVERLYRAVLQREGDAGGIQSHSDNLRQNGIAGWVKKVTGFTKSDEFTTSVRPNRSNRDILETLYTGFLLRTLNPDGARIYLNLMRDEDVGEVSLLIATSDEFFNKVFDYSSMNQDRFFLAAQKIFRALMGRLPTGDETNRVREIHSGSGLRGVHNLILEIVSGQEFENYRSSLSDTAFVNNLFLSLLGRGPTAGERTEFLAMTAGQKYSRASFQIVVTSEFFDNL